MTTRVWQQALTARFLFVFGLQLWLLLAASPAELRAQVSPALDATALQQEAARLLAEAVALRDKGRFDEALPLAERAVALREQASPVVPTALAEALDTLGFLQQAKGRHTQAIPLFERALALRETALGPEQPAVADVLLNLGGSFNETGDYARAEPLFLRALAIHEKAFGPEHQKVSYALNSLGVLYFYKGEFAKAAPIFERTLAIREKTFGADHSAVATMVNNLAAVHQNKGDYAKSATYYQRALAIYEKTLGREHSLYANSLNNLGLLYQVMGNYAEAEQLLQRALTIQEKVLGPTHAAVGTTFNNLGLVYRDQGDYARAEQFLQRALTVREQALGQQHSVAAQTLNNLGLVSRLRGEPARAETSLQRALMIWEKALGTEHKDFASGLHNLAQVHFAQGNLAQAEAVQKRALSIRERILGATHPETVLSLNHLAAIQEAKGELPQALELRARSADASDCNINLTLTFGSESQRRAYLETFQNETNAIISLHVNGLPADPKAMRLALLTVLRRKGRTLDAMADSLSALRQSLNPADRDLLDQFIEARARLARLWLSGPGRNTPAQQQAAIKSAEELRETLEGEISRRSSAFRTQTLPVTLEAVQVALPPKAALLEFVTFKPTQTAAKSAAPAHYAAYALRAQGPPQMLDLGPAAAIDAAVSALRSALREPQRAAAKRLARDLDELVMRPLRPLVGDVQQLLIAPDGSLNLIPFAALLDERGHWLLERFHLTYLTSGRDLLRLQTPNASQTAPLLVAAPAFGAPELLSATPATPTANDPLLAQRIQKAQFDAAQIFFGPLPGAASEIRELRTLLPQATVLTGEQATESTLKQTHGPRLLHIATHGFFLSEEASASAGTRGADIPRMGKWIARVPDPLLRSGLALAGANQGKSGPNNENDGVLTALETAGLDLWGTKLVVLSACDTGVGEVRNGDGVYGLRRALVLAGAESQLMSLWPVADRSTRDLMVAVYRGLLAGQGRGAALRMAQLQMLKDKARNHPYYWASFIQSGEWANLEGQR